jgi:hypothetical protein
MAASPQCPTTIFIPAIVRTAHQPFGLSPTAPPTKRSRPAAPALQPVASILLAVDQQLGERPRLGVPIELADLSCAVGVGKRQDMEERGTAGGTEGVQALPESALKFIRSHQVSALAACSVIVWTARSRMSRSRRTIAEMLAEGMSGSKRNGGSPATGCAAGLPRTRITKEGGSGHDRMEVGLPTESAD